jgi:Ca-activated chloride channel family protein
VTDWLRSSTFADLELRDPWLLLLGALVPFVFWAARRIPNSLLYSSLAMADLAPRSVRVRLAWVPAGLVTLAFACLALAMSGPRTGDSTTTVKREGIAIMLAIDRSGSMDARDFVDGDYSVNRLGAVKEVVKEFVLGGDAGNGRPNDLIGIVAFGTYADGICPLTLDHENLVSILDDVSIPEQQEEQNTAIGEGLALAVERLREHEAHSKVVVLLTDGVNTAGDIAPMQAAALAKANGVTVYTIGAGTTGLAPMPARHRSGRQVLIPTRVEIDEKTLKQIAGHTAGRYFHARDAEGLRETYRAIDALERSEISQLRYLQYEEHYPWLLGAALILVVLATVLGGTYLRRLP